MGLDNISKYLINKQKQQEQKGLTDPNMLFEYGSKLKLHKQLHIYEPDTIFTVINDRKPDQVYNTNGIGETYLSDPTGRVILINGKKTNIGLFFENYYEPVIIPKRAEIREITPVIETIQGEQGDRGDLGLQGPIGNPGGRGEQGIQGVPGEKGDKGDRGETGHTGWTGDKGLQGVDGPVGPKGEQGDRGEQGIGGDTGEQGIKGDKGDTGEQGIQGIQGLSGKDGSDGLQGIPGVLGERGEQGIPGLPGLSGEDGKDGETGEPGISGVNGKDGVNGEKGEAGESGIVSVEYPLNYEADKKHLKIEQKYFDELNANLKNSFSAQGGGGSNVAIYKDGERYINVVKSINFTGDGVNVSKDGNKLTVNVPTSGNGGSSTSEIFVTNASIGVQANSAATSSKHLFLTYSDGHTQDVGAVQTIVPRVFGGGDFNTTNPGSQNQYSPAAPQDIYTITLNTNVITSNRSITFPNTSGTIITTGNLSDITPFITNLSLNTNGELVATYSNGTEINVGDVVELDQPLDGGTF